MLSDDMMIGMRCILTARYHRPPLTLGEFPIDEWPRLGKEYAVLLAELGEDVLCADLLAAQQRIDGEILPMEA